MCDFFISNNSPNLVFARRQFPPAQSRIFPVGADFIIKPTLQWNYTLLLVYCLMSVKYSLRDYWLQDLSLFLVDLVKRSEKVRVILSLWKYLLPLPVPFFLNLFLLSELLGIICWNFALRKKKITLPPFSLLAFPSLLQSFCPQFMRWKKNC